MPTVATLLHVFANGVELLQCLCVLPLQKIQITNVVIALRREQRHVVLGRQFSAESILLECFRRAVHTRQNDGPVYVNTAQRFRIVEARQNSLGLIQYGEMLRKPVESEINISNVDEVHPEP